MVKKIGIIGYGTMGKAVIQGLLNGEKVNKRNIIGFDIDEKKNKLLKKEGFLVAESEKDVYEKSCLVIIAVTPQDFLDLFTRLKGYTAGGIVMSIAAGITLNNLETNLPNVHFIRALPNSPIEIGEGMTALCKGKLTTKDEFKEVVDLFKSTGKVLEVEEKYFNSIIPLCSSMPAFVFSFIDAFLTEAKEKGLTQDLARTLLCEAIAGSAKLASKQKTNIKTLINNVSTPGGITSEGLDVFEGGGLQDILQSASNACTERADEFDYIYLK